MIRKWNLLLGFLFLTALQVVAQDSGTSITTTTSTSTEQEWYVQPWVWVVGGAVLLLLLIALLRGGGSRGKTDQVTYTKTVERDV
ncbi:MAG: hypothetical protein EOO01_07345 [Chitinophagaceae bacterium]|nr:MAG: hypothetical protein EOO01_07345 [Chitinophagaceae bacterium]